MSKNKKILKILAGLALSGAVVATGVLAACGPKEEESPTPAGDQKTGTVYYVSADGVAANDGLSIDKPTSITILNSKNKLEPGDTVYLIPGTYEWESGWQTHDRVSLGLIMQASGTAGKNIRVVNAALDKDSGYTGTEKKVTLDFSDMEFDGNNRGVQLYGDYIYWYGIDICGAGDNGLYIGGSFNTVEYCDFYNNRDTGLQLGRSDGGYSSINQWPSYNLIKNCTSHNNYDDETYGENADGFAAKLTIGYGNVFDGCIAYRNSDDGWDLYAKSDSGNIGCVIIYNCVAFENGYLEYTQETNHNKLNYKTEYNEPNLNSYKTRDGDGNGFKLGGSVMEGDVKMYNCLSFQNRMHGVTDNSNPGYLKVEGVTSYDNSAAIDNSPTSATFGQVISANNDDTHGNIDVARQTYSYNTVKNVLSVKSSIAKSLDNDAYRGSVINSLLVAGNKTNVIRGAIDADTKEGALRDPYTEQKDAISATDVFKTLPVVKTGESYTYNITGLKDSDNDVTARVHDKYRNEDHSINFGDLLAVKDGYAFGLGDGVTAGSTLNKGKWEDYTHFVDEKLMENAGDNLMAKLLKAQETLTINTEESAVYQDFEVPSQLTDCPIMWSTDSNLLTIGQKTEVSLSQSEYITIGVSRPTDKDTTAKLTATISYLNRSVTKVFELNIKKDEPAIGNMLVRVAETGEEFIDGSQIIMDAYKVFKEPTLEVQNGASYSGVALAPNQYSVKTTYKYATDASGNFVEVSGFMPNHPGVYSITHEVTLASNAEDTRSMSYQIFVAAADAQVAFKEDPTVSVFRDGYIISGPVTNVTGTLYTVASATPIEVTKENIKTLENVKSNDFKATNISFAYDNPNNAAYYIYYAIANQNGDITSEVGSVSIGVQQVANAADFLKVAGGTALNGEDVSKTIYTLANDIDFITIPYTVPAGKFTAMINGMGHTVKNVDIARAEDDTGLFSSVEGGTIMNIKFDNIVISGAQRTAIVSSVKGGYFHNIAITNICVTSTSQRNAGLIGQVFDGTTPTEVSQVSIVNPIPKLTAAGEIDESAPENMGQLYYIYGAGNRAAGIIGFIQPDKELKGNIDIKVSDCYVSSYIKSGGYSVSSIVGDYNDNGQLVTARQLGYDFTLSITNCVSAGVLVSTGSGRIGGMLGYHNGSSALTVTGCLSIQTTYYKGAILNPSQKNQSPTIGGFSTSAEVMVTKCISLMEEYNTDYEVIVYTPSLLARGKTLSTSENGSWVTVSGFDMTTKWSYVLDEDSENLKAPYIMLNFLTD